MTRTNSVKFALAGLISSAMDLVISRVIGVADPALDFAGACIAWYASGTHFIGRGAARPSER